MLKHELKFINFPRPAARDDVTKGRKGAAAGGSRAR